MCLLQQSVRYDSESKDSEPTEMQNLVGMVLCQGNQPTDRIWTAGKPFPHQVENRPTEVSVQTC